MNLDDLKNFKVDFEAIKHITPQDIKNFINERQALVLSSVLVLIALIVMGVIINVRSAEYYKLSEQLKVLRSKEQPINDYEKVLKDMQAIYKLIPSALSENNMIPFVAETANKRGIQIDSFEPPQTIIRSFYRETKISFICGVTSFQNALLFIHDLESSKFLLKVDSVNISKVEASSETPSQGEKGINLSLSITSIELLNNDQKKSKKK